MVSSKPMIAASNTDLTAAQDGHSTATQSSTPRHKPRLGPSVARTAAILYQHTTAVAPPYEYQEGEEVVYWSQSNQKWQLARVSELLDYGNLKIDIKPNTCLNP